MGELWQVAVQLATKDYLLYFEHCQTQAELLKFRHLTEFSEIKVKRLQISALLVKTQSDLNIFVLILG